MANAHQAPANAEGPTSHTQNQVNRLTAPQLRLLFRAVHPNRVGRDDKGFAHMQAWDIKRYLLRVFGFCGYDTENRELTLIREIELPSQQQGGKSRWTVVYRAQVRLIVKDVHGNVLGHWDGEAAGGASNLPKLDDAHDMALKTASSQAFKRAATHLGDAFGLSLYNDGSKDAVVTYSAAHPPEQWEKAPAPLPAAEDSPVRPEPDVAAAAAEETAQAAAADAPSTPARAERPQTEHSRPAEPMPEADPVQDALLDKLMRQAVENRLNVDVLTQVRGEAKAKKVIDRQVQGPPPERAWMPFHQLLDLLVQGAKAAQRGEHERNAA